LDLAGEEDTTDGIDTGLAADGTAGLGTEMGCTFAVALTVGFNADLFWDTAAGFAAGFCTTFGTGFADAFSTTLTDGLTTTFGVGLEGWPGTVLPVGFTDTGFTAGFGAVLGTGTDTDLPGDLTAVVTIALPVFDFTSCLLAGLACACSVDTAPLLRARAGLSAGVSSARECTGSRLGKPISCKSETIIGFPNLVLFNV
jgi:hypothetical protein